MRSLERPLDPAALVVHERVAVSVGRKNCENLDFVHEARRFGAGFVAPSVRV